MAVPNAFSNLLGKENSNKEKLISRGACISWGPKNLGSWLIMQSIRWMVKNTDFRYFTAYSDPEAKELGTIYQACNFHYLGQTSGTNFQYLDPDRRERGWFSDREFRKKSSYMKYAKKIAPDFYKKIGMGDYKTRMFGFISWAKAKETPASDEMLISWAATSRQSSISLFDAPFAEVEESLSLAKKWVPNWKRMDKEYPGLKKELKRIQEEHIKRCKERLVPAKHKYCYILGRGKKETKALLKKFAECSPNKQGIPYPKTRGKY
jgi:hypothetical protein